MTERDDPTVTTWDELVTVALVGTERRALPVATAPDGTALVGPGLATDASRVLAQAAVLTAWRAAGQRPAEAGSARGAPAPVDGRPACPPRAAQLLDLVLDAGSVFADQRGLIRHWLDRCAAAAARPAHRQLIPLLARATADASLRPATAAVVDERGRWLAARRAEWAWVGQVAVVPSAVGWSTAGRAERRALLVALRGVDPTEARLLLEADVRRGALPAAERAELVAALATGLGPDDEALLDELLDDRAQSVRAAASALLDRLPDSARGGRLAARLAALVGPGGRLRRRVEVELPDDDDAALVRDLGGDARESSPLVVTVTGQLGLGSISLGRRSTWLLRLVAAAPLGTWREVGLSPDRVVAGIEGRPELVIGLAAAVVAQGDREWAETLFTRLPLPALVPLVPAARAEDQLGGRLGRASDRELPAVLAAAAAIGEPWSAAFSGAVVDRLRAVRALHVLVPCEDRLVERLHHAVLPDVEAWIGELAGDELSPLRRRVRQLHQALTLRHAITEEFNS